MLAKRNKAAVSTGTETTAKTHNQLYESYRNPAQKASENLTEKIGVLLLILQTTLNRKQQENGWKLFGVMLRQYIDLKYRRVG